MIVGIGKAGNPDVMANVTPGMVVGVNTEVISAEGLIVTAGGLDTHVHFICPQILTEAIASGLTTLLGGGTGPATGTMRDDVYASSRTDEDDATKHGYVSHELRVHG